jgi:hypothetical protein
VEQTCRIHSTPDEVEKRLASLGLAEQDLVEAVRIGDMEASWCTENDPRVLRGFTRWGKTFRGLADRLVVKGWAHTERRSLPVMVNAAETIGVTVSSGDDHTGKAEPTMPKTRNPKGLITKQIVYENQPQLPGIANAVTRIRRDRNGLQTWFLLYHFDRDSYQIRAELSLAASMGDNGYVAEWFERIVLTPSDPVELALPLGEDEDEDEISIHRRDEQ